MDNQDFQLDSNDYDFIVLGTGLTECILSAALSRIGKKVLHLELNKHYGSQTASLQLDNLTSFLGQSSSNHPSSTSLTNPIPNSFIRGYQLVDLNGRGGSELLEDDLACKRCSIDLIPKLIWSKSVVIDTLIRAGVSRYLEFKAIAHLNMKMDLNLQQIPVSKSDVFKSDVISLKEKRQLMKFIEYAMSIDKFQAEDGEESKQQGENQSFAEFLNSQNLSDNLISFIRYAIAMEDLASTTKYHEHSSSQSYTQSSIGKKEGLARLIRFLSCVGRYGGHSPWIYPLFGIADLNQAFCRISAVYGATFILGVGSKVQIKLSPQNETSSEKNGRTIDSIEFLEVGSDATNLISDSHKHEDSKKIFSAKHFISNFDHMQSFCSPISNENDLKESISRSILILKQPLNTSPKSDDIHLTILPPNSVGSNPYSIYAFQLDESSSCVPKDHYLVQLWTRGSGKGAENDLKAAVEYLCLQPSSNSPSSSNSEIPVPSYISYFSIVQRKADPKVEVPVNLTLVPDFEDDLISADQYVEKAKILFEQMCPGEEFIPTVPNPDDIIWDGDEENEGDQNQQPDEIETGQ